MNPFAGLTHYEIFEVSRGAGREEIEAAWRRMRLMYSAEGLATYSLFTPAEREGILALVEEAYRVLTDPQQRREYDLHLIRESRENPPPVVPQPSLPFDEMSDPYLEPTPVPETARLAERLARPDPPKEISGESLRRYREGLGLSLDKIYDLTRIRKGLIQAIEEEKHEALPKPVFLKGMLASYARVLGLGDPEMIAQQYLDHLLTHQ